MSSGLRLHVRIDVEQSAWLRRAAAGRGVSVASIVRTAIEREIRAGDPRRRAALEQILAAEPIPVPTDPAELAAEAETMHGAI